MAPAAIMSSPRAYAAGTTVSIEKSQGEIRELLRRHRATAFGLYEDASRSAVQFTLAGVQYRFDVDRPSAQWAKTQLKRPTEAALRNAIDAEERRRWRARLLWLKATLEFAAGDADLPTLLAGVAVLVDGRTLGATIAAGDGPLQLASGQ